MSEGPDFLSRKGFLYFLSGFNLLFLTYVLTVGYYNRMALDDFAYLGVMRDYGFFNPFTYWYFNWQGRFAPQFFLNVMFWFYKATSSLFFYPIVLGSIFIYSSHQILKFYFPLPKLILLNFSVLLFSALLLTTFELSTFYWICASVDYFGGMAFTLLGAFFILKKRSGFRDYVVIALCFIYAGSSSENVGALMCMLLIFVLLCRLLNSAYNAGNLRSHLRNFFLLSVNKKLLTALFFCSVAFIVMVLAPGTNARISAAQHHITDPIDLLRESWESTLFVSAHIFFKLPYILAFFPLFLFFGSFLKIDATYFRIKYVYVLLLCAVAMLALIYLSNLPVAYAIGQWGPLRSYVYISFFLVALLFFLGVYTGSRYRSNLHHLGKVAIVSLAVLFAFVFYTFYSELPLLKKYNQVDKERIAIINEYKRQDRTEPVFLPPLYDPKYFTVTDMWRALTRTDGIPSPMTDMPVFIGEISETADWRNGHLKHGLDLKFDVYLAPGSSKATESK